MPDNSLPIIDLTYRLVLEDDPAAAGLPRHQQPDLGRGGQAAERACLTWEVYARVVEIPRRQALHYDGTRLSSWTEVAEPGARRPRVVTLPDRTTIHVSLPGRQSRPAGWSPSQGRTALYTATSSSALLRWTLGSSQSAYNQRPAR